MSLHALDALYIVGFIKRDDHPVDISRVPATELRQKLRHYRESRLREPRPAPTNSPQLNALISTLSARNSVDSLIPSGFIYNCLYTNDPVFTLAGPPDDTAPPPFASHSDAIDLSQLNAAISYFCDLAPVIRAGIIQVLPLEELHAPGREIPIYFSEDNFRSEIPSHIHDFIHRAVKLCEVAPAGDAFVIHDRPPDRPTRGLSVTFLSDSSTRPPPFYLLTESRVIERIGDRYVKIEHTLDWDKPPSTSQYSAWEYQVVNRTIINRMRSIASELRLANELGATYLTESEFEAILNALTYSHSVDVDRTSAIRFLDANAPFLNVGDPQVLVRARTANPHLFERWQASLLDVTQELGGLESNFEEKAQRLFRSEIQPQIDDLKQTLAGAAGQIGGAVLLGASSVGFALLSGGALPLSALLALGALQVAGQALPTVTDYFSRQTRKPAYIWKRIAK